MRKLFIILFIAITATNSTEAITYNDAFNALLIDMELALDEKNNISLNTLTIVTNKADTLRQEVAAGNISDEEAVWNVIEIYVDQEGLYCENLAETIKLYNDEKVAKTDSMLLSQCTTMESRMAQFETQGWAIPARIQTRYDKLIELRNSNTRLMKQERERRLATPGFYVTETEIGNTTYVRSQIQDPEYGIIASFPNNDVGQDYFALTTKFRNGHDAVDLAHCGGCPVLAVTDGIMNAPAYHSILGWYAMLVSEHINMYFVYGHLSKRTVRSSVSVIAGQTIGLEGHSGRTRGSKGDESVCLHFKAVYIHSDGTKITYDPTYAFKGNYKNREMNNAVHFKIEGKKGKAINEAEYLKAIQAERFITMK